MFPINQFEIKKVKESGNTGTYAVGPLPKGYGHTLGNVFRRVLLSSVQGAAVTRVKMNGVQHEYSTLAGIQDDVLSVILAIKGINVVSHAEGPATLYLTAKGKKGQTVEVTAADIEKNALVEIINPEHKITTLTDSAADLNLEITVEKGFGYALPNEDSRKEIGSVPIDSIFNPVVKVGLNVTNTRVGQQTDLDLVELEIETNGAITPSAALHTAAEIMTKISEHLLESVQNMLNKKDEDQIKSNELPIADKQEVVTSKVEPVRVSELNLSTRLTNALMNSGYDDLNKLSGLTEEEVRNIKGMGEKSFEELIEVLENNSINLI